MKILFYLSLVVFSTATITPPLDLNSFLKMLIGGLTNSSHLPLKDSLSKLSFGKDNSKHGQYQSFNFDQLYNMQDFIIKTMLFKLNLAYVALCAKLNWLLPSHRNGHNEPNSSYSNICIFSRNPTEYQPKCFLCPNAAYPAILKTCEEAEAAPNNVTFSQAECMELNCAINYPKNGENIANVRVKRQLERETALQNSGVSYADEKDKEMPDDFLPQRSTGVYRTHKAANFVNLPPNQFKDLQVEASEAIKSVVHNDAISSVAPVKQIINGTEYNISGFKIFFLRPDNASNSN